MAACQFEREQVVVVSIQMNGFALSDSQLLLIKPWQEETLSLSRALCIHS